MEEASENATHNISFSDTLIAQWMQHTGSAIPQMEQMTESSSTQQALQKRERIIDHLKRMLKESQEAVASLSTSLETKTRKNAEIRIKLNATWKTIESITEYINYISESLSSFEQHRVNLSALYDNVIQKQKEAIEKLQLNNTLKTKDLEDHVMELKNELQLREKRLQEAMAEQNKLYKQLQNFEYELQLQKNELNTSTEEKLIEQQCLIFENENLKSQLQTIEKEKCDIAKSVAQLENKLLLQEEKMQNVLTEQNKLHKQVEDTEREFHLQRSKLASAHAEEKKILVEEQQRLLSEFESLQSQVIILEQEKTNIIETVTQNDALLSKLQDEIFTYKNQMEMMQANNNEMYTKYEALTEKQNMREKESRAKSEKIQNLEAKLSAIKQRESKLINDINRIEKKLNNVTNYSKDLVNKLSNAQKDVQFAQEQSVEMQKTLEMTKSTGELANIELQQQLKALQMEKEEVIKRKNTKIKTAEVLYENMQAKNAEEVSALKSDYKIQLFEMRKTIDSLFETINNLRSENIALNVSLIERRRAENRNLRGHELTMFQLNIASKRNPEQEKEAQEWIESIIGKKFPPGETFEDVLKDGQVLCHLMNKISPGSIPKINSTGGQFKMMENINLFQKALKDYGVDDVDVFQTVDLWEKKDIAQVITTLFALGRTTYKHPEWKGPYLGPKPADECKREFTEEQLRAGEGLIGLQAGSNKGATQAGQSIGATRKILLGK
ncbi:unnamed protein product [Lasius platythorax]